MRGGDQRRPHSSALGGNATQTAASTGVERSFRLLDLAEAQGLKLTEPPVKRTEQTLHGPWTTLEEHNPGVFLSIPELFC